MNKNRWFWSVTAILSINVLLVAASGIRAHMQQPQEDAETKQENPSDRTAEARSLPADAEVALPTIPSLEEVPADIKSDPVYQEIKKMFSESGGSFETPPLAETFDRGAPGRTPSRDSSAFDQEPSEAQAVPSEAYFSQLDRRLKSATQLCETARGIAAEAAIAAKTGDRINAKELLQMATQLREMAANLISRPL